MRRPEQQHDIGIAQAPVDFTDPVGSRINADLAEPRLKHPGLERFSQTLGKLPVMGAVRKKYLHEISRAKGSYMLSENGRKVREKCTDNVIRAAGGGQCHLLNRFWGLNSHPQHRVF